MPQQGMGQNSENLNFIKDSIEAIDYYNTADTCYMNISKCKKYSKLALPLLRKTKQWVKYINCFGFLSYCYDYEEAYDSLILNNKLAFNEAKKYLPSNISKYVYSLNNLGYAYSHVLQDYYEAIDFYQDALDISERDDFKFESDDDPENIKGVLSKNIGDIYLKLGDYDKAITFFEQASSHYSRITKMHNNGPNFRLTESFISISKAYQFAGKTNQAIEYIEKLLVFMNTGSQQFPSKNYVYAYTQLAELKTSKKRWNDALKFLSKANKITTNNDQKAEINRLYSLCYLNQGNYKKAHQYIDKVFDLKFTKIPIKTSRFYQQRGEIYVQEKKFQKAIDEFTKALPYLLPDQKGAIDLANFNAEQKILSYLDLIKILNKSAACYRSLENQIDLKTALRLYTTTSQLSSKVQFEYQSEKSKSFLNENVYPTYEEAIEIAFQLFGQTKNQDFLKKAFYFFERSKAGVLLEEIQEKETQGNFANEDQSISKKYRLRSEINACEKRLQAENEKPKPKEGLVQLMENKLFELNQELADIEATIKSKYPEYTSLTSAIIPEINEIQKRLSDGEGIVEYFIGEKNAYAIFITNQHAEFKKISSNNIEKNTKAILKNLKLNNGKEAFSKPAHELYQNILEKFDLASIESLIIVPDGILSALPFDILLTQPTKTENPKTFDFLIKEKAISYAYSSSLLALQTNSAQKVKDILFVAPIFESNPNKFLPIKESDTKDFRKYNFTSLKGTDATVDQFLKKVNEFGLVYFYTHAFAAGSNNTEPYVEFADTMLYLRDLYALNLPTELVILSACETGIGAEQKGEGIMSLARGFTYAGVPSTVATLWKVNDQATKKVMRNFQQFLTNGLTKSKALQKAKLSYLENCNDIYSTPYYWAGAVTIGNDQAMDFEKRIFTFRKMIVLLISFIGLIVFLFLRKKVMN